MTKAPSDAKKRQEQGATYSVCCQRRTFCSHNTPTSFFTSHSLFLFFSNCDDNWYMWLSPWVATMTDVCRNCENTLAYRPAMKRCRTDFFKHFFTLKKSSPSPTTCSRAFRSTYRFQVHSKFTKKAFSHPTAHYRIGVVLGTDILVTSRCSLLLTLQWLVPSSLQPLTHISEFGTEYDF